LNTITRHFDELIADVNSRDVVAETRKVLAEPAGTTTYVENPGPGRQCERTGHVCEIGEVAMGFRVHALAKVFVGLVGQVVKRLSAKVMTAFGIEHFWIFERRALVVDAFELGQTTGRFRIYVRTCSLTVALAESHDGVNLCLFRAACQS